MKVTRKNLDDAVSENILSASQADALLNFLSQKGEDVPRFTFTHVLYYLGGLIAIGAMTLFMTLGWETFGGAGIVCISLFYAAVGLKITQVFADKGLAIPAGICATFVICLTPLAIYGFQQWFGIWPDESVYRSYHERIRWHWLYMEFGTLIASAIMLWKYRYPFMTMPVAITLWYMTMDAAHMLAGGEFDWDLHFMVSMYSGLLMIGLAFWIDIRSRHSLDYAFWIYILGVIAFWGGMTAQDSSGELSKFIYFCINLIMIFIGVLLVRRVFVVFGAIGVCTYLAYLAENVFRDSWLFPISLSAMGLAIIYLGVLWQRHEADITARTRSILPGALRELLESKV